ncbi:hypothetical protein CYMTET_23266 [Cymbomonas tetramitiformis]|uniref:Uncharacterized protein n=1 Tax=Cymbomonas tetramitiformis TaxID=36881 RepID=A0AAE0L1A1_9CHLO|nr:hypothetical protein CYMTET_23266 [Cymbomonas tetramitiformis]
MLEQQEDEEMLQIQEAEEQHEPWEAMNQTTHNQEGNPPPTGVSPQPSNEEGIFERLNKLVEQQETPQGEQNEEDIFERLNELIEQQETARGIGGKTASPPQQSHGGVQGPCDAGGPGAQNKVEPTKARYDKPQNEKQKSPPGQRGASHQKLAEQKDGTPQGGQSTTPNSE